MSESVYLNDIMKKRKQEVMFPQDQQVAQYGKELAAEESMPKAEVSASGPTLTQGLGAVSALANAGGSEGGPVSGALSGAAAGSLAGPIGAGVGAAIGTIGALAANKAKRKALARQIEQQKYQAISQIQMQHGQQEAAGIQNMIAGLRSAYLR